MPLQDGEVLHVDGIAKVMHTGHASDTSRLCMNKMGASSLEITFLGSTVFTDLRLYRNLRSMLRGTGENTRIYQVMALSLTMLKKAQIVHSHREEGFGRSRTSC